MSDTLKVMLVGARSKIAESVLRILRSEKKAEIVLLSSAENLSGDTEGVTLYSLPHGDYKHIKEFALKELPSVIINCAAMTDVDGCEIEKEKAWNANVTLVEHLIRASKVTDAHFIHFSTDYIFDGKQGPYTENDTPNPINYYGKTKLAAENVCHKSGVKFTILRTNVVYGHTSYNHGDFVQWVVNKLETGKPFRVVDDQYGNPTFTDDIALAVLKVIEKEREGIYNIAGSDYCNRFEFAKTIAQVFQYDSSLIETISTSQLGQLAHRPLKAGLVNLKAETDLGIKFSKAYNGVMTLRHQMQMWGK